MVQLRFSRDELLSSHPYAQPYMIGDQRMHGGFDVEGHYRSPRTARRHDAIAAWKANLEACGHPITAVPPTLYSVPNTPSVNQQAYLLQSGINRVFYDALTAMAEIETKAGRLCKVEAPDFRGLIRSEITDQALGHLNAGLLEAHGMDEGGDPAHPEIGGHDRLWLAARDLLFPFDVEHEEEPLGADTRVESGMLERRFDKIPEAFEFSLRFFMTVLLSEARADLFFAYCARLLQYPEVFRVPAADVRAAAGIIARIEQDEAAHVGYLTVMFSELRAADWGAVDGKRIIDGLLTEMTNRQLRLEQEAAHARSAAITARVKALSAAGHRIDPDVYLARAHQMAA